MSHYEDEAQVEQLRRWWRENWQALAAGLVIGLGGIFGWQTWQTHQQRTAEQASQVFEDLKKSLADKPDDAATHAQKLTAEYDGTPYAAQGELLMAQADANKGDWAKAQGHLEWVMKNAKDPGLQKVAKLRLARVLWQQSQLPQALALLEIADDDAFAPLYLELRGDIQLAQGERAAARESYQKALKAGPAPAARAGLQRKLDDLTEAKS